MSPLRDISAREELVSISQFADVTDEEVFADSHSETVFDMIVGAIEDIIIEDGFQDLQNNMLEKYFHHFDVSKSF